MSKDTRKDVIGVGSIKFEEPVSIWTALGVALNIRQGRCCVCGDACKSRMCDDCAEFNAAW